MSGMFVKIVAVFCLLQVVYSAKLPDFIKKCKRGPTLNDCIKENMETCRSRLNDGIPQLSVPKMVPFTFPKVALESSQYTFELKEVNMMGLADFQIQDVNFALGDKDITIHLELVFPKLELKGNYMLKGKVLMLELNGNGAFHGNTTDTLSKIDFNGKIVSKKGKDHLEFEGGKVKLEWRGKTWGYFDNLFGDRKDLTEATNQVIQDNIQDFVKELGPITENVVLSIVMGILKPITNKFPVDDLFDK